MAALYTLPARVGSVAHVAALVSWYVAGRAPDHLYTFSQLKPRGLKPRNRCEQDDCIVTAFHDVVSLYDIREVLRDQVTLVAYNVAFDQARLAQSARRYRLQELTQVWECAMEAYAAFCGNWSDYHGSYTWIPLVGGHRAVGDALAALERVREMVAVYEREYAEHEQS